MQTATSFATEPSTDISIDARTDISTEFDAAAILDALATHGYYRSPTPAPFAAFERLMASIASVKRPMELRTGGRNPVLESERGMTPHNDCNHYADCVAWYCRRADGAGDRTFITEIAEVISALSREELDALAQIGIRLPLHEVARTRVVRREDDRVRVFWSFSAVQVPRSPERARLIELVQAFRSRVNEVGARARIQGGPIALDDGQFLIIDDHRFFHGRDPLPPGSRRHLFRCYLRLHDPRLRAAKLAFQPDHANQADRADRAE